MDPDELVELTNPTDERWHGQHDSKAYYLEPNSSKMLPRWLAHFLEIQARDPNNGRGRLTISEPTPEAIRPEAERGDGSESLAQKEFELPCEYVLQGCKTTFKSRDTAGYRNHLAAHVRAKEREAKVVTEKANTAASI